MRRSCGTVIWLPGMGRTPCQKYTARGDKRAGGSSAKAGPGAATLPVRWDRPFDLSAAAPPPLSRLTDDKKRSSVLLFSPGHREGEYGYRGTQAQPALGMDGAHRVLEAVATHYYRNGQLA